MDQLEYSDRKILVETYYYCHTLKETANELGITENAAKTRLFRARARLKKYLRKEELFMKIDFYDLFSHYVPDDFSEAGSENYVTAVIKKRSYPLQG
ncbi:MAG: hypothetical protein HFJ89_01195 [Oscillospiraceae bacterium]|jgi:hypothetical protein|nr:hypothetical protein [Oscillospiraceae bacterium]